jgi:hypothetical protein
VQDWPRKTGGGSEFGIPEAAVASSSAVGGVAPVAAGGAGMGGMGMMGGRGGSSGGTASSLAVPAPLEHDLAGDDVDDDW